MTPEKVHRGTRIEFENIVIQKEGNIIGVYKGTNVNIWLECKININGRQTPVK